jgi:hypothetical protein
VFLSFGSGSGNKGRRVNVDPKGWKMRFVAIIAATVGILAIAGTADDASAQARRAPAVSLTEAAQASPTTPAPQRRGLRWNDSGRWGLNFNLNQPVGRETDWGDVEAGAYYRLSPRLRVGAAANLASPELDPARAPDGDRRAAPRVRLETIFKF